MQRGAIPVAGVVVLLAITVVSAATVGVLLTGPPSEPPPTAAFELSVDSTTDEITLTHRGGDRIDVTAISVRISIDGQPLEDQPPVPFFSAPGFHSGPTGPFNSASSNRWSVGESATLTIASTNDPELTAGATVRVQILTDTATIADLTETT